MNIMRGSQKVFLTLSSKRLKETMVMKELNVISINLSSRINKSQGERMKRWIILSNDRKLKKQRCEGTEEGDLGSSTGLLD